MNFRLASLDSINLSFMSSQRSRMMIGSSAGGWWSLGVIRFTFAAISEIQITLGTFTFSPVLVSLCSVSTFTPLSCHNQLDRENLALRFVTTLWCVLHPHLTSVFWTLATFYISLKSPDGLFSIKISAELLTKPLTHELRSVLDKNFLWHFIHIHRFNS